MKLHYTLPELDRRADLRLDEGWITTYQSDPGSLYLPIWQGKNLFHPHSDHQTEFQYLSGTDIPSALLTDCPLIFLGIVTERAYFALDLSHLSEVDASREMAQGVFRDLREFGPVMPADYGALAAYARAMVHWHQRHQFCGRCGRQTVLADAGHRRLCPTESCQLSHFPRLDPAVIMLVTHTDPVTGRQKCLLGRSPQFPEGVQSTLAGFVEPGESLEDAVRREVFEEAGVKVGQVHYKASQPWPFPSSIMVGFQADALSTEIQIDRDELVEANWYTPEQVANAVDWTAEGSLKLPRQDSISYFLIKSWLAQQQSS